jgi:hypothetical protein
MSLSFILTAIGGTMKGKKEIEIFISHSAKDHLLVESFHKNVLVNGLQIPRNKILCTSIDGSKPNVGDFWEKDIKDGLVTSKVHINLITKNFINSEYCKYEMGAAWILEKIIFPILIEPIQLDDLKAIHTQRNGGKISTKEGLNDIAEKIVDSCDFATMNINVWDENRDIFLKTYKSIVSALKYDEIEDIQEMLGNYGNLKLENEKLKENVKALQKELLKVKETRDISGVDDTLLKISDELKCFKKLSLEAKRLLNDLEGAGGDLNGILFNSYVKPDLGLKVKSEFGKYVSNGYIDEDGYVLWDHPDLEKLAEALQKIQDFIEKESSEDFGEIFQSEYENVQLNTYKADFWRKVIGVSLYFD